jgi:hypothetical protein
MSVNGIDTSIFRVKNLSSNTIERWLEWASKQTYYSNHHYLKGYEITEVQADEIRTFVDSRKDVRWLFTAIEISSRLWISIFCRKEKIPKLEDVSGAVPLKWSCFSSFSFHHRWT